MIDVKTMVNSYANNVYSKKNTEKNTETQSTETEKATDDKKEIKAGNTYGNPKLSDKALDYYNSLKKKYGTLNFVLVAADKKEEAEAIKGSFASSGSLTVLIDTDKIERMAEDESYRKQIESTIQNAITGISELSSRLESNGTKARAYGMTIDKSGNASFFAVVDKSLAAQKERIQKNAEKRKADKKEKTQKEKKEVAKEKRKDKLSQQESIDDTQTTTISAGSIDELMKKLEDYQMNERTNQVQTEDEKSIGQKFDYSI